MTTRTSVRHTFLYLAVFMVFVLMILAKQAAIRQARSAEIVSILNEWQRDGKPVCVQEVVRRAVAQYVKITLQSVDAGRWQGFVPQKHREQLAVGQDVFCDVPQGRVLGTVARVADTMTLASGMYAVEVKFDQPIANIEPGLVAYIHAQTFTDVIAVADEVLDRQTGGAKFAWIVRDGRAYNVPVVVGRSDGFGAVIEEGLSSGDMLIVAGQTQLQSGDKVNILSPQETVQQKQGKRQ